MCWQKLLEKNYLISGDVSLFNSLIFENYENKIKVTPKLH